MRSRMATLVTLVLTLGALAALAPGADAAVSSCQARNLTQGTGTRALLEAVLDAADPGDRIKVKGVCVGHFHIGVSLTLVGAPTPKVPRPVLRARNGYGRVLYVGSEEVTITNVKITDGSTGTGGGIITFGNLTLRRSVVSGNFAPDGGGIYNQGTLTLYDSVVRGNEARHSSTGECHRWRSHQRRHPHHERLFLDTWEPGLPGRHGGWRRRGGLQLQRQNHHEWLVNGAGERYPTVAEAGSRTSRASSS